MSDTLTPDDRFVIFEKLGDDWDQASTLLPIDLALAFLERQRGWYPDRHYVMLELMPA